MRTLASELGAHYDQDVTAPRVYVDANVPLRLVNLMRQRLGWDTFAVIEHEDLRRATDLRHFRLARQMRRTLISLDRDYLDDKRFPREESGGLVVISAPNERAFVRLLQGLARDWRSSPARLGAQESAALPLLGTKLHLQPKVSM